MRGRKNAYIIAVLFLLLNIKIQIAHDAAKIDKLLYITRYNKSHICFDDKYIFFYFNKFFFSLIQTIIELF